MKTDLLLCGVGGQGVVSLGALIAGASRAHGLEVMMSEVHGMAQRRGSVQATLRLSDRPIESALVPKGTASGILGLEPLEALRHLDYLAPDAFVVSAVEPQRNISDYPPLEEILERLRALPRVILVEAEKLARRAGSARMGNVVLVGAAAAFLPVPPRTLEDQIRRTFAGKGERVVAANLAAFASGREVGPCAHV